MAKHVKVRKRKPTKPKLTKKGKPFAPRGTYTKPGQPTACTPEVIAQCAKLCELGATDMELAHFFNVTWRTIYHWKNTNAAFTKAMEQGKEASDNRVVRALYQRAIGYDHDDLKIFMPAGAKKPVMVPFITHVPPDVAAATLWLKNRRPDEWRDKQNISVGGDADAPPVEVGASSIEKFFSSIVRLTAASGTAGSDEPNDGGNGR